MNKGIIKTILVIALSIIFQSSVFNHIVPPSFVPDILLVVILLASLRMKEVHSLFLAFFSGLFQDFTSAKYLGPHTAGNLVAIYFLLIISKHIYADRNFSLAVTCFLCVFLKQVISLLLVLSFIPLGSDGVFDLLVRGLGVAFVSALVAPFLSRLLFRAKIRR